MATLKVVSPAQVANRIHVVRGHKVVIDSDLAALYGVETRRLNEQVRRNAERFPADFMFQMSAEETAALMSQFATSNARRGGRRKPTFASPSTSLPWRPPSSIRRVRWK